MQKYYIFLKYAKKETNICVYAVFFVTLRDILYVPLVVGLGNYVYILLVSTFGGVLRA